MVDITNKTFSLRQALASAIVKVSKQETIDAVQQKKVPIEYAAITYQIEGLNIIINVEVHTIYKTGVEVEAMHGASVTALTIYDMLKPIDKQVEISTIKLAEKKGGKSDF